MLAHPETKLSFWQKCHLNFLLKKRQAGFPLAYLTGHKEFFGLDFLVNKHTLIPRPETELMVEQILDILKNNKENFILIDVGTGSGCIPISILKNTVKNIPTFATDISRGALKIARRNARQHRTPIKFFKGNLLMPILSHTKSNVLITANLPYLNEQEFIDEPTIQREPKSVLVAHENGLGLYRALCEQVKTIKNIGKIILFLEINPEQATPLKKIILQHFPHAIIEIKTDLAGRDRLVIISLN